MGPHGTMAGLAPPPADSRDRLRADLTREVADLRCRLHEIALRGEALIEAGQTAEAARVLAEQRVLLRAFEDRIARHVAAAKVLGEAELAASGLAG